MRSTTSETWSRTLTVVDAHGDGDDGEGDGADGGDRVDVADGVEVRALRQDEVGAAEHDDVLRQRHVRLPAHQHIHSLRHMMCIQSASKAQP